MILPAQPPVGETFYVPLGGDGYMSPFAAHSVRAFDTTGDASGTFVQQTITLDPRFCSLVSYITIQIGQATSAAAQVSLQVNSRETSIMRQESFPAVATDVRGFQVAHTWRPPAIILPGGSANSNIVAQYLNVNTDSFFLDVWVYLFNIRVRETTPVAPLLWAQGGSS